ncbi:glycoside hydrolase family 3 protein [Flammeovirga pacifica]|uniref:beta-N-acetylhexosaminidase n=1 Tax=Flammeovirga pacifica TaxID=915059 RepID=A0A1S1YWP6_FLAPC|nr:glycoside hydrolase family 3 protein [Flammeovirga pacifica]OHX65313.1 hypothetical protein NH26_02590 [Flammeovirga pacifica]
MSYQKALILILFLCFSKVHSQSKYPQFYQASWEDIVWVDSVWKSLNDEEKIAQLFIVPHYTKGSYKEVKMLVQKYNVGGVIYFKGDVDDQINAINNLNSFSKTPLVHTLDAEWGLGMRLPKSGISYPYAMTLGAIENDELIYQMTSQIAKQLKQVGVGISYGPVVDINNNPENPVISYRSFGEDKMKVTSKGWMYAKGLEDQKVLSVIKHFPGHGDTNVDSHKDLPVIPYSRSRLDSLELYPFNQLVQKGVGGVMTAHLSVPELDPKYPSSLSEKMIKGILREDMNFRGIVFTDGILMDAITKQYHSYGKADAQALKAGNDVVEFTNHIGVAIKEVKTLIDNGELSWEEIDKKGWKMLLLKRWLMVDEKTIVKNHPTFDQKAAEVLIQNIADEAMTLLLKKEDKPTFTGTSIGVVNIGKKSDQYLIGQLQSQGFKVESFYLSKYANLTQINSLINKLHSFDNVITQFGSFYMSPRTKNIAVELGQGDHINPNQKYPYGVTYSMLKYMEVSSKIKNHHAVFFGNAYVLRSFRNLDHLSSLTIAYQDLPQLRKSFSKVIIGDIKYKGILPVSIDDRFKAGMGIKK